MLTPEQAKALQDQRGYRSDERRRAKAVGALPEPLRPIAYGLLHRDAHGILLSTDYERQKEWHALEARSLAQLDALAPDERALIFASFFPGVPEAIERGWVYVRAAPFARQISYREAFFRAPHRPDVTLEARGIWLLGLVGNVGPHDDLVWLAHHAAYLQGYGGNQFGLLFAAAIDSDTTQGDEVFDILLRSARGEDEIGMFGRHIPVALLAAARPDGWACVERLLLGAQREEGVRQTILEALDVARPEALRHLLGTILDQNLVRFSAVTYVVNGWLDTAWDSSQAKEVNRALRTLHAMLGDPDARRAALEDGSASGEEAYLALWATACDDIYAALPLAGRLLEDAAVARRYAAARLLSGAHIPEAIPLLLRALGDPDARVAAQACGGLRFDAGSYVGWDRSEHLRRAVADAFERIEALLPRLPRLPKTAAPTQPQPQPLLWNAPALSLDRERVADLLLDYLGERDPRRLIPQLGMLSAHGRWRAIDRLATRGLADPEVRTALFGLLKDRSSWVSNGALKVLQQAPIQEREAPILEALLGRKSDELRRGVLRLLLAQPDELILASAERLLAAASSEQQRLAGLEALRLLHEDGRGRSACAALAADYRQRRRDLTAAEQALLAPILAGEHEVPRLENALGLIDPADCSALPAPQPRPHAWTSPAAIAGLLALDALIHEHRGDAYVHETYMGKQEAPLGSEVYYFPSPDAKLAAEQDVARLPFADLWREWAAARGAALRDEDGLELLRMLIQIYRRGADETRAFLAEMGIADDASESPNGPNTSDANSPDNPDASAGPRLSLRYPGLLEKLCWWLVRLASASDPAAATRAADSILDHLETVLTEIPERELREPEDPAQRPRQREFQKLQRAVALARTHRELRRADWTDAQVSRLWRLLRWSATLPQPHLHYRPTAAESLAAHRAGAANEADLVYQFLGPRPTSDYRLTIFDELRDFSSRKPHLLLAEYPIAGAIYARCVRRVLEVELARGAMPTAATPAARSLRSVIGASWFVALLRALGGDPLSRGAYYGYGEPSKAEALGHLLRVSFPAPDDTPQHLKTLLADANIPQQRLIEAAVYAPQWAGHVEHVLGWAGFAEAVWWVRAHTKDRGWTVDAAVRQEWEARIGERTPLSGDDLYDGAVDVAWFQRVYTRLGAARWEAVYQAAKYSSSGTGHARARLFADAMLGTVDERTLTARIAGKRNRDAACALGLLPLPRGKQAHERALLSRYQVLQDFIRTARGFGAQRREGDQKAARIGLENLSRTAGYPDAQRFQWAIELRAAADLRAGAIHLERSDVTLTLRLDALGQPHLDVTRGSRALKAIPVRLKKDPEVVALRERAKTLEQQRARMRLALEQAMCRQEAFPAEELRGLLGHPLLAPLLEQLVFVGTRDPDTPDEPNFALTEVGAATIMGYPVEASGTLALRSWSGEDVPVPESAPLRVAHAYDLYRSGAWSQWQRECFAAERIQPFKQVFRELYVLTEAERRDGQIGQGMDAVLSRRYAGHQIQPRQAFALLGQRGWVTSVEDASATRTFHERGITASVEFVYGGGGPIDAEGLTIEGVCFHTAGDARDESGLRAGPVPLEAVAPVVFSEAMRDLDLVVSVAHRGGVDPEASASTVEMRAALIREVTAALGITNVQLPSDGAPEGANGTQGQGHRQGAHVRIQGELGEYALHLGSGTVHRLPGGAICIVPVQAQHRGRLFLPFADDDPKTAEIVSKVLLLARDTEIRDPLILQQIYAHV